MSIKKNIAYNVTLNVLNVLFPVITVPYVSRVLGVENVGLVSFVLTYVSYFVLFATLGIGYYGVREIARHQNDRTKSSKIFSELFLINIVSTFVASVVFLLTVYTVPLLETDRHLLLIAGLSLYLAPLSIDWYFQGLENFRIITIRSLIIKGMSIAGLFVFVRQSDDLIPYILLNVGSVVVSNMWNVLYAKANRLTISFRDLQLKKHIRPVLVLFVSVLAISIFTMLDTLMLGFMSTYTEVGYYTSCTKVTRLILPVFTAIGSVLLPRLSFNQQNHDHLANAMLLQKSFDLTAFFTAPAMIGLLLIAPRFVPVFFGAEFLGAIIPMQILSALMIIVALNVFFGIQILIGMDRENLFLRAVLAAAAVNIFLNIILIPRYGAEGAAIASVCGESLQLGINLFYVHKFTVVRIKWTGLIQALACSAPIVLLFWLTDRLILNGILFILLFVLFSTLLYIPVQYFGAKNYLLISFCDRIKTKLFKP